MIRILAAALCLSLTTPALAATTTRQERMKTCNKDAGDLKGDERKAFMSKCLKGEDPKAANSQQQKMKDCNEQAKGKKGDEHKKFMSECLKAK